MNILAEENKKSSETMEGFMNVPGKVKYHSKEKRINFLGQIVKLCGSLPTAATLDELINETKHFSLQISSPPPLN